MFTTMFTTTEIHDAIAQAMRTRRWYVSHALSCYQQQVLAERAYAAGHGFLGEVWNWEDRKRDYIQQARKWNALITRWRAYLLAYAPAPCTRCGAMHPACHLEPLLIDGHEQQVCASCREAFEQAEYQRFLDFCDQRQNHRKGSTDV